jgi:VanZ family protein
MSRLRWVAALAWTALTLFLMLTPSIKIPYNFLGDLTDKAGHLAAFCVLAILWYLVLTGYLPRSNTFWITLVLTVIFGACTELGQYFVPGRDVEFFDFVANALGATLGSALMYWRSARMAAA